MPASTFLRLWVVLGFRSNSSRASIGVMTHSVLLIRQVETHHPLKRPDNCLRPLPVAEEDVVLGARDNALEKGFVNLIRTSADAHRPDVSAGLSQLLGGVEHVALAACVMTVGQHEN